MESGKRTGRWWLSGLCLVMAGCVQAAMILTPATVPLARENVDAEAKRFDPQPGMASIYVIRDDIFTGQLALFQVSLDGKDQGKLARGTYLLLTVRPGKHEILFTGEVDSGSETVDAAAGSLYFFEIRPKESMTAPPTRLLRIDPERGRKLVSAGRHAQIKAGP